MDHIQDIVNAVFAYLQMLQNVGPQQWYFDEMEAMSQAYFLSQPQASAHTWMSCIIEDLFNEYLCPEHVITYCKVNK
ncbi:hypothetical protein GGI07_005954, partial [Coemansia sp. Benny D115]